MIFNDKSIGIHRKLILNKGNWQSETAKISLNDGSEVPCLEFATQCLRIALSLLPKNLPNKSNIKYVQLSIFIFSKIFFY